VGDDPMDVEHRERMVNERAPGLRRVTVPLMAWIDGEAHFRQVRDHGGRHGLRDENALEASLARPRQRWACDETAGVHDPAASYAFALIRNHPYVDGNKRVGLVAMVAFLDRNGYELIASDAEVVEVVLAIAAGDLTENALADWVASRARPLSGSAS
jgi:death-on-curing protein